MQHLKFEELLKSPPTDVTSSQLEELRSKCIEIQKKAYCPYSKFHVGSSILSMDESIFVGCNIENASYPASICAERTALSNAIVAGHKKFKAIMLITDSPKCASPCGVCRQFISEFGLETVIMMLNKKADEVIVTTINSLLPLSFTGDDL